MTGEDPGERLRAAVREVYSGIAEQPLAEHPFPVGRRLAEAVGYAPELLRQLPDRAVEAFAGVTCIHDFARLRGGSVVLDLGCGAGMDSLIAARAAEQVVGVDFSPAMLERARKAASEAGVANVEFREGAAESIPAADASFDVALVNGIFNLNPARELIFSELARVLRPGGALYAAELILAGPLPPGVDATASDWFA